MSAKNGLSGSLQLELEETLIYLMGSKSDFSKPKNRTKSKRISHLFLKTNEANSTDNDKYGFLNNKKSVRNPSMENSFFFSFKGGYDSKSQLGLNGKINSIDMQIDDQVVSISKDDDKGKSSFGRSKSSN